MTLAAPGIDIAPIQHLRLSEVPWEYYEQTLAIIGDGHTRVTYLRGEMEMMSPLPKHETWGLRIGRLIELMALERAIPLEGLGSTTFRDAEEQIGLEPDECYYVGNIEAVRNLAGAWNPTTDPPPDLAIEIDITRRSIEREPIYAGLGVKELWRFDGRKLTVRSLQPSGLYETHEGSEAFPFLPVDQFVQYLLRFTSEPQLTVLNEFRQWVGALTKTD